MQVSNSPTSGAIAGEFALTGASAATYRWFFVLFLVTQFPLYALTYPGIADYPNHAARLHVLVELNTSPVLQQFYRRDFSLASNMAMDTLALPLAHVFGAALGLKIFASVGTLLLMTGAIAFSVALTGRLKAVSLGVLLFAESSIYHWGLFSYIFGTGLAFWLLAGWIGWRNRAHPNMQWMIVFAFAATGLYLCHLAAFGVYMLGLVAYELGRPGNAPIYKRWLVAAVAAGTQATPALTMHLPAYLAALPMTSATHQAGTPLSELVVYKIVQFLYAPVLLIDAPIAVTTLITVCCSMWLFWGFKKGQLSLSRPGVFVAAALFLAVLLLPVTGFGSALVDRRVLLPLALAAWASLKLNQSDIAPDSGRWMAAGIAMGVVLITATTYISWSKQQAPEQALRAAMRTFEQGSKVAVLRLDAKKVDLNLKPHTASWSVVDRSVFLSSLYMKPFTPLALRCLPAYVPLAAMAQLGADIQTPTLTSLREVFDYAVVFGNSAATDEYAANTATLYSSNHVRLIRLRLPVPSERSPLTAQKIKPH